MTTTEFTAIEKKLVKLGVPVYEAPTLALKVYNFAKNNRVDIDKVIESIQVKNN